jgi:hypothetical protein
MTNRSLSAIKGRWVFRLRQFLPALLLTLLLSVTLGLATISARAETTPGWRAFTAGDHEKAEAIWRPLAESGDHNAAFGMAVLAQTRNQLEQAARWY